MNFQPLFVGPDPTASTAYAAFLKCFPQSSSDGNTQILDSSAAANQATLNGAATYAGVTGNVGFATALSAATAKGFGLAAAVAGAWDMSAGKSFLLAFQFKSASNANPSVSTNFVGNSGGGGAGFNIDCNTSGRLAVNISDGTHTYASGHGAAASLCDGVVHTVVVFLDGTGKKIYFQVDGVTINSQFGTSIAAVTGSTANNSASFGFGNAGGGSTWDSGGAPTSASVQFRNIHLLVLSAFPSNSAAIMAWLVQGANIFKQIPASLLP